MTENRVPPGIPSGGQYAVNPRTAADMDDLDITPGRVLVNVDSEEAVRGTSWTPTSQGGPPAFTHPDGRLVEVDFTDGLASVSPTGQDATEDDEALATLRYDESDPNCGTMTTRALLMQLDAGNDPSGLTPDDLADFEAHGFDGPNGALWHEQGFNAAQADEWYGNGLNFGPKEAAAWCDKGFTSARTAGTWADEGFKPAEASEWADNGVHVASHAAAWREAGIRPKASAVWNAKGFDPENAGRWNGHRFHPEAADAWSVRGFDPDDAVDWSDQGFTPESARSYRHFDRVASATEWRDAGFGGFGAETERSAEAWSNMDFEPQEARAWANRGFRPQEAGIWRADGFGYSSARQWSESGFDNRRAAYYVGRGITSPHEILEGDS